VFFWQKIEILVADGGEEYSIINIWRLSFCSGLSGFRF